MKRIRIHCGMGMLAGPDGSLYVSHSTNVPTGGQVLRFTPVPEPGSLALLGMLMLVGASCARRLTN